MTTLDDFILEFQAQRLLMSRPRLPAEEIEWLEQFANRVCQATQLGGHLLSQELVVRLTEIRADGNHPCEIYPNPARPEFPHIPGYEIAISTGMVYGSKGAITGWVASTLAIAPEADTIDSNRFYARREFMCAGLSASATQLACIARLHAWLIANWP